MAMDSKKYRDYLHQSRSHPRSFSSVSSAPPASESHPLLYFSALVLLGLEIYLEFKYEALPQGIAFPFGFLLSWAFYYTYLKPGHLEFKLKSPQRWEHASIPTVILNSAIWFVKICIVELTETLIQRWVLKAPVPPKRPEPVIFRPTPSPKVEALPKEIENALSLLGLKGCRDWNLIQKRYRELAKRFHPDLNPELTAAGNRFIIYDGAYRRLVVVKEKYFKSSCKV